MIWHLHPVSAGDRSRASAPFAAALAAGLLVAGCSTVPSSGPTSAQIRRDAEHRNLTGFSIVDIGPAEATALPAAPDGSGPLAVLARDGRTDTLGPGDALQVDVFEVGVSLFARNTPGQTGTFSASAGNTALGAVVSAEGTITLPYVGRITVAGKTPAEVERQIETALVGLSQRPQVTVLVRANAFNTFYVSGDIRQPGRFDLGLPRQRLLDAIARAGGTTAQPDDVVVQLTRDGRTEETRLSQITASGPQNVLLLPGDRVELFNRPRTFLVFGASDKISQVPFGTNALSLAEAMARIGGPSERIADPAAVYLFRWNGPTAPAAEARPVVYRLNMMRADSYLLSQRFRMQDKDVVFIASAAANAPAKLTQIIGQLFTPLAIARSVTR